METAEQKRYRTALELHEFGVMMMRQNLRRQDPQASEEVIRQRLRDWLAEESAPDPGVASAAGPFRSAQYRFA